MRHAFARKKWRGPVAEFINLVLNKIWDMPMLRNAIVDPHELGVVSFDHALRLFEINKPVIDDDARLFHVKRLTFGVARMHPDAINCVRLKAVVGKVLKSSLFKKRVYRSHNNHAMPKLLKPNGAFNGTRQWSQGGPAMLSFKNAHDTFTFVLGEPVSCAQVVGVFKVWK